MTASVPRQSSAPDEPGRKPPEDRRHVVRRRVITLLIILLLVGVPAGYLLISAEQSRQSGRDKEKEAAATGLLPGRPSTVQRSIYDVPVPAGSTSTGYYETSNWKVSRLYTQFRTTAAGLEQFLKGVGTGAAGLKAGAVTISASDAAVVGWTFPDDRKWAGTTYVQKDPQPTVNITVDVTNPASPMVYVVSATKP
ncbi:hypothetical protein [Streptomyces beijiangensis]|uniref:Uncharacterized protein n=1 Tax=Streptomyces beijiangensis TaxID=163361 RepID=A0A939F557_9ACTN|nr:hypothetical protein [Streptomyces beijiangensis]MBO0512485.1 hypothetical protein [Streptomyces beijiangensis]